MKATKSILILAAMIAFSTLSYAQTSNLRSTRVIGHMCVELVSPAAITSVQSAAIKTTDLNQGGTFSIASVRLSGNETYAVTMPERSLQRTSNNQVLSVSDFTASTNNQDLSIAANLKMQESGDLASMAAASQNLVIAINFN